MILFSNHFQINMLYMPTTCYDANDKFFPFKLILIQVVFINLYHQSYLSPSLTNFLIFFHSEFLILFKRQKFVLLLLKMSGLDDRHKSFVIALPIPNPSPNANNYTNLWMNQRRISQKLFIQLQNVSRHTRHNVITCSTTYFADGRHISNRSSALRHPNQHLWHPNV